MDVGIIGLGLLGGALARRFRQAGHTLVGYDVREEARPLVDVFVPPAEVCRRCERIVLSLPDSSVVARVVDEAEIAAGKRVMDTTTGDPVETEALAAHLRARGVAYVDATVLGNSEQALAGEVLVMAGGSTEDVQACGDLFDCFARQWFHVGPSGAGARMKLVVNLVLGLNRAVLAEGLAFGERQGLDLPAVLAVLRAGAAYSRVMDTKGDKMLQREFSPQARLRQHLKDVNLILAEGARTGARLPLSQVHRELLERVVQLGGGEEDNSAVLRAYDGW